MVVTLVNSAYQSQQLLSSVFNILTANELCAVSTVTADGQAHIHTAYFCYTRTLNLFFVSDTATIHAHNLLNNPSTAIAVYNSMQPWDKSHSGLQLFGSCHRANIQESLRALRVHAARFHAYADYLKTLTPKERRFSPYRFYSFIPSMIKLFNEDEYGDETFISAEVIIK